MGAYQEHIRKKDSGLLGKGDHDEMVRLQQIVFVLEPEDLPIRSGHDALFQ